MDKNIMVLLNEYLEITKVMYSSVKARDIEIFENQLTVRAELLNQIEKSNFQSDQVNLDEIREAILEFEDKIEKEVAIFKKEMLNNQITNKMKLNSLKKSNVISKKYKYGSVEIYKSSFDKRK